MIFNNFIEEREFYGREALKDIMKRGLFQNNPIKFTEYNCVYDAIIFDKKIILVEIKIRDRIFDEYFLEYKKCKLILKEIKKTKLTKENIDIIYINFLKDQTVIWNINNFIYNDVPYEIKPMNESTFISRTNKVDKKVYLLNPYDGKQIDYKLDKEYLKNKYNQNDEN